MKLERAPPELVEAFSGLAAGLAGVEQRRMFGFPALFINGNMFAGLMGDRMVLRLAEADRQRLIDAGEATPSVAMGRVMREWVALDPRTVAAEATACALLLQARDHTGALPPKAAKPRSRRKPT